MNHLWMSSGKMTGENWQFKELSVTLYVKASRTDGLHIYLLSAGNTIGDGFSLSFI